jgi:hypothetical protein
MPDGEEAVLLAIERAFSDGGKDGSEDISAQVRH